MSVSVGYMVEKGLPFSLNYVSSVAQRCANRCRNPVWMIDNGSNPVLEFAAATTTTSGFYCILQIFAQTFVKTRIHALCYSNPENINRLASNG